MYYKLQKEQLDKNFLVDGSIEIEFLFVRLFFLNKDKEKLPPTSPLLTQGHIILSGACFEYLSEIEMGSKHQANA